MTPGLSEDIREIIDARKTAVINSELKRLQIDIVINGIATHEQLLLLGDFNVTVGTAHDALPCCLGHYSSGKMILRTILRVVHTT
jgi:hypothetical protein